MVSFMINRFITAGVSSKIGLPLQLLIWGLSKSLPCEEDYLQVFILNSGIEDGKAIQNITQKQEQPDYQRTFAFYCANPVNAKLFLIRDGDDGDETDIIETLLLAEEY
jgi:hypothetical protein